MASGGRRNRSGPKASEDSARSDARGYKLEALPAAGYNGPVPDFPLPRRVVKRWEYEEKSRYQVTDVEATDQVADRELELWQWAWTTPQACAWSLPSESWRLHTIAMWVRTFVICEGSDSTAADKASLHRFADQIGMTTAGLAEMGWKISLDGAKLTEPGQSAPRREPTLREQAAADAGWQVIDGERAG